MDYCLHANVFSRKNQGFALQLANFWVGNQYPYSTKAPWTHPSAICFLGWLL